MPDLAVRIETVLARIREAEQRFQRPPGAVALVAVSKMQPTGAIVAAVAAGLHSFGENYLKEALEKIEALKKIEELRGYTRGYNTLDWHFIGPIQSNKTRGIAEHFDWVHSVDRLKIAQRLSVQRPAERPPLNVCLQVNISEEPSKSGVALADLPALAQAVALLPRIVLRGLMAVPAPCDEFTAQRKPFARLREAQQALTEMGLSLDTLSMGMTDDLEAAIAEGATLVRIGTAIFGPRPNSGLPKC